MKSPAFYSVQRAPAAKVSAAADEFSCTPRTHVPIAAAPRVAAAVAVAKITTNTSTTPSVVVDYGPLVKAIGRFRATPVQEFPFVVAEGVSREFFEDFLSAHESNCMDARLEYRDSRILVCECPVSAIHDRVATSADDVIRAALGPSAFDFVGGAPSCRVGANSFQADASLTPLTKPNPGQGAAMAADDKGNAFPNVVIEVAVSQSFEDVQRKARDWISQATTVQQVLVFRGGALDGGARQLHANSYIRGNHDPVQTIDFSIPEYGIVAAGNPAMQLLVPLAGLYFQVPGGPPAGLADPLVADLFFMQRAVAGTL